MNGTRVITALAVLAALALPSAASASRGQSELAKVRASTARFHDIDAAKQAGHRLGYIAPFLLDHCIAHPTDGAMGYHYFNHDAIHDTELDPQRPEGLVYEPRPNGTLRLVAVEWIVPKAAWEAAGNTEPPRILGQELHVLNPALGWYILHAWVWKPNPSGMFHDWNPNVDCS
jgi:hypothetical protein